MSDIATLYKLTREADKRFSDALKREYGKDAGDIRYQPAKQTPDIRRLGEEYSRAAEAWRNAIHSNREE